MPSLNRIVMQRTSRSWLEALPLAAMDAGEISGKNGRRYDFQSYAQFRYPEYDICDAPFLSKDGLVQKFDIILANQVWEHLDRPHAATRNVLRMLRMGGYFWLAVPFFVRYHGAPHDCSRWSARGLKNLLVEAGFEPAHIRAEQWGNRQAAARNLEDKWPPNYDPETDDLTNDPNFPICAWALAQKV